jgi:hypothetical protein
LLCPFSKKWSSSTYVLITHVLQSLKIKSSAMSEQIKNTLFRFATMRTPELVTEKVKADYHIHHPDPTGEGYFKVPLGSPAASQAEQMQALTTLAATFGALNGTDGIKDYAGAAFFDYAVWLAKNRTAVFTKKPITYSGTIPAALSNAQVITIWDNLLYQLITSKAPQLRQQCIELLIANGYIAATGQTYQHQLAEARVVIPASFYGGEAENPLARTGTSNTGTENTPGYTGNFKAVTEAVIAREKIADYQQLSQELQKAEKKYAEQNKAAYDAAGKTYEALVKAEIDEYYTNNTITDEERERAAPTKGPDIPVFQFTPLQEMQTSFLQANLSPKALSLAEQLSVTDVASFKGATAKVDELIKNEIATASSADIADNQSLVINNMVFPVNRLILPMSELYSFYIQTQALGMGMYSVYCTINMGTSGVGITSAQYNAELTTGVNINSVYTTTIQGNAHTLKLYPQTGFAIPATQTSFRFHGAFGTTGGNNLLFDVQLNIAVGTYGIMTVQKQGSGTGGGTGVGELTAPSGYGIKRLGLADYRKVEQSVCCYLPGEVSHIENVMAREYKERSSRRLTRSEDTSTLELSMEKETQKDSSTTERFELQKEIDSVISKDTSADAHTNVGGNLGNVRFDAGASFATNTSREDSNHTAVNYSREVTEKALERVVQKVRQERTIKIVEEFEEQNKHGFDNRLGDKHVSGVYRWVDKVYKNQVFNYGKRLMYEFMVPQPAVFHNEAIKVLAAAPQATVLEKPVDPRTYNGFLQITDHTKIDSNTFPYWAGKYKADTKAAPDATITIAQAFDLSAKEATGSSMVGSKSFKMEIPDGYEAISAVVGWSTVYNGGGTTPLAVVRVANKGYYIGASSGAVEDTIYFTGKHLRNDLAVSAEGRNLGAIVINVSATCQRTAESYSNWQIESFNAIIDAYNEKLDAYNKAMEAVTKPQTQTTVETNPGFYRQIENTILRKNCISYLVSDAQMGKKFYHGTTATDIQPTVTAQMDQYAAMVKFIEQAFEWEIMSYKFYPFYWGNRQEWQQNYQKEVSDPLFRSFLQSGMARVIVSIRPGFEEAVMYFMATGQIWNGGQVPAIGDDLYLSIVEELKNPTYYIDETWETRVPTTLTIIQAGNIGLTDTKLPCDCNSLNGIEQNDNKLGNQLENMVNP